jgi:hypothetical protein
MSWRLTLERQQNAARPGVLERQRLAPASLTMFAAVEPGLDVEACTV